MLTLSDEVRAPIGPAMRAFNSSVASKMAFLDAMISWGRGVVSIYETSKDGEAIP